MIVGVLALLSPAEVMADAGETQRVKRFGQPIQRDGCTP